VPRPEVDQQTSFAELPMFLPEPYQMLLLSVLERAIEDLSNSGAIYQRAYHWIFKDQSRDVMSAYWVCQALGMHVDSLRRHLLSCPTQRRLKARREDPSVSVGDPS
jgi:hypothetical protein